MTNPSETFAARARGKAETCEVSAKCECTKTVNYSDHMIRDVLLNGISDLDIRCEVLGVPEILSRTVIDVIGLVEGKEMALKAVPSSNLSSVS